MPLRHSATTIVHGSRWMLAAGSMAVGVFGLVAPRRLARLMGDDPALARSLATRDLAVGAALLHRPGVTPLLVRAAADFSDALRLRRRSPLPAAGALVFGLWSLATAAAILASHRSRRNGGDGGETCE